jgi:hypothetical protein
MTEEGGTVPRTDDQPGRPSRADSSHVFGPPRTVVFGSLFTGVVCAFVLEFLVLVSFLGQRLWTDPRMGHEFLFTLPLLLWVLVLAVSVVTTLRGITTWLHVDATGMSLRGLCRRSFYLRWDQVDRVVAVADRVHAEEAADMLDEDPGTFDAVYLLDADGKLLTTVSGRLFTRPALEATLRCAAMAGVHTEVMDVRGQGDIRLRLPRVLSFSDTHPQWILALLVLFYFGHNVLTFWIWGL